MKRILVLAGVLFLMLVVARSGFAASTIKGKAVNYTAGGVTMKGYIAYDASMKGKQPAVLVVHEWWGHNEYARKRARMLADMGYTALAVDMYGEGKQAAHPDDAGKFSSETMKDFNTAKARFEAAIDFLKKQPSVDPNRIAAIGYCFGGGVVLNMARQGVDLIAVVSFHGSLAAVKPAQPGGVKAKILVYNGADDTFVSAESIAAFKKEMDEAKADYEFINMAGAIHGFTNPDATELGKKFNLPLAYNKKADLESWEELGRFLGKVLRN